MNKSDKNAPLRANIRFLGEQLGHVLRTQISPEFYQLEETLRKKCKQSRQENNPELTVEIQSLISKQSSDTLVHLTKAFGIYFQLVNLAEQHHRIQRKKVYETEGAVIKYSIEHLVNYLKEQNLTGKTLNALLDSIQITPVLTAHPTHIMRQTILNKHRRLIRILDEYKTDTSSRRQKQLLQSTYHEITALWQSNQFHKKNITITDEAQNLFTYFDASLFEVLPQIHEDLEQDLKISVPNMLAIGSWVGGDRDGHPFVTAQTTYQTLKNQKSYVLDKYITKMTHLLSHLSISEVYSGISPALSQRLKTHQEDFPELACALEKKYPTELYRQKLEFMIQRLKLSYPAAVSKNTKDSYTCSNDFLSDLKLIQHSLSENQGDIFNQEHLKVFVRQVAIFGFHLATLDIRQDSELHLETVSELFRHSAIHKNFADLSESEKTSLLTQEIQNPRPIYNPLLHYSENTQEMLDTFQVVKQCLEEISPDSISTYIISMCKHPSDILNVLLLAKETGLADFNQTLDCKLNIVPLFETLEDLKNAKKSMQTLYDTPLYRDYLKTKGQSLEIMLGYSDSSKRAGILAATWQLYCTQDSLISQAKIEGVDLRYFHGRGGSISRGGGPTHHAIMAQPAQSMRGQIRLTEQGEVLSWKYNFPELAHRELSVLLSSVVEMSHKSNQPPPEESPQWAEMMQTLSSISHTHYTELVEHPQFLEYFQNSTPLTAIGQLNIGSRPSKRKNTQSIHDLRAIPWVFSWVQSRCILPAWYGVGYAFETLSKTQPNCMSKLQQMYQTWPFLNTFIDNLHMTLSKADLAIAEAYSQLVEDESVRNLFWDCLSQEYQRTCQWVLNISQQEALLDHKPTLQKSINLRNPYVDPINLIQIELLKRIKENPENKKTLDQAIKLSIMGISEGLRNTG